MPKVATRVDIDALLAGLAVPRVSDDVDGRILDAAAKAMLRGGLSALEVDDVAAASGVGRSTVYRRFADRNALIVASLAREGRRFLAALAESVASIDGLEDQVVAAFTAGLRVVRRGDLGALLRSEPLLLQLMTVDSGPIVAAARQQLVSEAERRDPGLDVAAADAAAEILVRLAISFVVLPETALDLGDDEIEDTVRRHISPLVSMG